MNALRYSCLLLAAACGCSSFTTFCSFECSRLRVCRAFCTPAALLLTTLLACANPVGYAAESTTAIADQSSARQAFASARAFTKSGKLGAAETSLAALNRAPMESSVWYRVNAQLLLQLHVQLREEGRRELLPGIANRALQILDTAARIATKPADQAAAIHLAGFICERLTGDLPAALQNYEAAASLRPASVSAKEDVARVKRAIAGRARPNA